MKHLIFVLVSIIGSQAQVALKNMESKVYKMAETSPRVSEQGEIRPVFEGTTPHFKLCKVHMTTLYPKSRMRKEAYTQENEELIIIKEGELTVTIEGKTKVLKSGGVALIMSGAQRETRNVTEKNTSYYVFQFNSVDSVHTQRAQAAGGSLMLNWDEVPFKAHDKGGRKDFFNRPTSMAKRFEMHTTTLNEGLMSHPAHQHPAAEIIMLVNSQGREAESTAEETINGIWHKAAVGDLIFLQSNDWHGIKNSGKGTCTYFAFQFE